MHVPPHIYRVLHHDFHEAYRLIAICPASPRKQFSFVSPIEHSVKVYSHRIPDGWYRVAVPAQASDVNEP